ncbi:MAG: deoxyribose-phosphate aldolase [Streptosporangiaceae bacterium]|nr:deoxyribose-phosphate aldolase [Streptosporangiaceae bacterium]MBV9856992.1 deoxyribose-phosphate aldolase [Streptosporangiaceae bacterium]
MRELRARCPEVITARAAARKRRPLLRPDGRLMIVAADHPARGALGVRGVPNAMANRYDLLGRLLTALSRPGVDGLLATADVIEDLLLLGALDDKIVIGSMNRGGLQGASFELDDRFTGYDAATIAAMGLDGGKMLTRIDPEDPGTAATLESAGHAVTDLGSRRLLAMVEPFMCRRVGGRLVNDLSAQAVIKSVAIASGLGATSGYTWLKLPAADGMAEVMAATTLPVLLLGGDPEGPPAGTYARWEAALALPGVRGFVAGRTLLYPEDGDVAVAVDAACALVHA